MENNYNNGGLFPVLVDSQKVVQAEKPQNPFILGNTIEVSMQSLQEDYLVPVFSSVLKIRCYTYYPSLIILSRKASELSFSCIRCTLPAS